MAKKNSSSVGGSVPVKDAGVSKTTPKKKKKKKEKTGAVDAPAIPGGSNWQTLSQVRWRRR